MNRGKKLVNLVINENIQEPTNNPTKENRLKTIDESITLIVLNEDNCHVEKRTNFNEPPTEKTLIDRSNFNEPPTEEILNETSNLIQLEDLISSPLRETFEKNIQNNIIFPQELLPMETILYDHPNNVSYQDLIPLTTNINSNKTDDDCIIHVSTTATTHASFATASSVRFSVASPIALTGPVVETTETSKVLAPVPSFNPERNNAWPVAITITNSEPLAGTSNTSQRPKPVLTSLSGVSVAIPTNASELIRETSNSPVRCEAELLPGDLNPETTITCSDPNNHNMNEGRKRRKTAEPMNWKRNLNKRLRMEGKSYTGFRVDDSKKITQDKPRNEREIKPTCSKDKCIRSKIKKCSTFTQEQRTAIFKRFWGLTWEERKAFVCGHVIKIEKQKMTVPGHDSRRKFTLKYRLSTGRYEDNVEVCRELFINTLGVGYRMVQSWVNKGSFEMPGPSTSISSSRAYSNAKIEGLKNFLQLLPKMPSHYGRQNSCKLYLEPIFQTIQDVYQLYCKKCKDEDIDAVSRRKFREVMESDNISLFQLKKDQCNMCKSHEAKNITDEIWNEHIKKKELARTHKQQDKEKALAEEQVVIEVDFQAVKLAPFTNANAFYYKTKLACHNYTCYNVKTKKATCYWFSEDQNNQLVASSFVSCLIDYLKKYCLTPDKKDIVIYSDGCTAQNRNNIMANALLNFSMLHGVKIYQKYLEVGHTQMEVDSVHGCIERKLKGREIKLPSDYVNVTKEARKNPCPYEALELEFDFFKDYTNPLRYKSIRPGRNKNDPTVMDIKVIAYSPDGIIKVKLYFDGDYLILPNRPTRLDPVQVYPALYTERCKITKSKWLHLQELKSVIPRDCHQFYDNLPYKE